ncbi:MAG: insulinase family protein [Acutalibacteraceae bacterium]|nr:insulinase family protein [Acutalibacteraceae bacterium]
MPQNFKRIAEGVDALYLPNKSFNTTYVSVNFYVPLNSDTVAKYALLPEIMVTCSQDYPDYLKLNYKLSELYGADVMSNVSKVGNSLCIKLSAFSINNRYAFGGENVVEDTFKLLLDIIFNPKVKNGAFYEEDVKREKRKLIERIRGDLNEKRIYARNRLIAEMFEDDSYGLYRLGTVEQVNGITGKELYSVWQEMLSSAYVSVNIIGEQEPVAVYERLSGEFSKFERKNIWDVKTVSVLAQREQAKTVEEKMDVAQGKLVMGFNCDGGDDDSTLGVMVMCDIFGGGTYSRLFNNVREKMSLCYYCSAQSVRNKGYITVDCGIEQENAEKARQAILNELEIMQEGKFTDFEFESSLKNIGDSLKTYNDSQSGLDVWYTLKAINGNVYSPEEIIEKLGAVTKEQVIKASKSCKLNTVYMLSPAEKE